MDQWKKHISLGNQYFDKSQFEKAKKHYCLAIARSNQLFNSWLDPDEAVWSLMVSYQNLAELYEKQKHLQRSLQLLEELYEILQEGIKKPEHATAHDDQRVQAIQRGINCCDTHLLRIRKALGLGSGKIQQMNSHSLFSFFQKREQRSKYHAL